MTIAKHTKATIGSPSMRQGTRRPIRPPTHTIRAEHPMMGLPDPQNAQDDIVLQPVDGWSRLYLLSVMMHPTPCDELDCRHLDGFEKNTPSKSTLLGRLNTHGLSLADLSAGFALEQYADSLLLDQGVAFASPPPGDGEPDIHDRHFAESGQAPFSAEREPSLFNAVRRALSGPPGEEASRADLLLMRARPCVA